MAASPLFQPAPAGSRNGEDWSLLVCFLVGEAWVWQAGMRNVRERERANMIGDLLFNARCRVTNVTSEVESYGNFPCQKAPGRAAGIAGWQKNPISGTCDVLPPQSISARCSSQQGGLFLHLLSDHVQQTGSRLCRHSRQQNVTSVMKKYENTRRGFCFPRLWLMGLYPNRMLRPF